MSEEINIDLVNPKAYVGTHPHKQFDWLRKHAPYYKHPLPNKQSFWAVTRYNDIAEINRDYRNFSSTTGVVFTNHGCPVMSSSQPEEIEQVVVPEDPAKMMIMMDPPEHTKYRKLISKDFTPNNVKFWKAKITNIAKNVVDDIMNKGSCEFVAEVSGRLAGEVAANMLGLPTNHGARLYDYTKLFHDMPGSISLEEQKKGFEELSAYLREIIRIKKENNDGGLACRFLFAEIDGKELSERDFFEQFMLIVNGGTDTSRNVIALGLYELLRNPKQLAWLLEDLDKRMPLAREEILRFTSPLIYQCRTATQNMNLDGHIIKKGDLVALYYGAANFDDSKFEEPHCLNLARENNNHLAFGGGHHICIGQWLARVEIDIMLKEVLSRLKNIQLLRSPQWLESNFLFGLKNMYISFER